MYAETGLFFPYMQNFAQDFELFEEYCKNQKPNASTNDMVQTSATEYNLEGEVDMFKALEPIIEEPIVGLDPMTEAISLISCGEDVIINSEGLRAADTESFPNEQLLEVLYECEKDLMAEAAVEVPLAVVMDFETPVVKIDESQNQENEVLGDASFQKSVSSGSLSSMGSMQGAAIETNFLDFSIMDFGSVYTMRRSFSEGDIKTLGNGNVSVFHPPVERPLTVSSCSSEDRREKLSRYRNKKTKRNFGRKIKYACRKALADSQPRIHGRFAKIEESDDSKRKLLLTN